MHCCLQSNTKRKTHKVRRVIAGLPRNLPNTERFGLQNAYVYMMSNAHHTVLYIGVTNNLMRRVAEHKAKVHKGFTVQYNLDQLVYFEATAAMFDAIAREKQLKNWKRAWKDDLVASCNPNWHDLSESIGVTRKYIDTVKAYYDSRAL